MEVPRLTAGGVVAVVAVVAGGFIAWKLYKLAQNAGGAITQAAKDAAEVAMHTVTTDLNPASEENLANRAFLAIPRAVTGDPNWSLGGWFYDFLHPHAFDNPPTVFNPAPATEQAYDPMTGLPVG